VEALTAVLSTAAEAPRWILMIVPKRVLTYLCAREVGPDMLSRPKGVTVDVVTATRLASGPSWILLKTADSVAARVSTRLMTKNSSYEYYDVRRYTVRSANDKNCLPPAVGHDVGR
jgi:hypothetical protein